MPRHIYNKKQKYLSLYLADTPENRKVAKAKAQQIESDIVLDRFDPTLDKYRFPTYDPPSLQAISLLKLWEQYRAAKSPQLAPSSRKILKAVTNKLKSCPYSSLEDAARVKEWLLENNSSEVARRTLEQLNACGNWAVEQELISNNPFSKLKPIQRKTPRNIEPFSPSERDVIITAFEDSQHYRHYVPFVKFLFLTGCRPSEAIALRWENIDPAMTNIVFREAIVEGQRKSTKTAKIRSFPINGQLLTLLQSLKRGEPDEVLFPSPKGGSIDLHNFRNRAWKTVVGNLPFRFRSTYSTRHTFITECLRAGIPVKQVAQWVGNTPKVLLDHYAGLTGEDVPEF